ncbi:MAG: hypothetical protein L6R40_008663 [Gallowayella cf. fulva]|nr:MAG: hypothetical protein L6R40_008663 [Xanthomendoza cf. fulva]
MRLLKHYEEVFAGTSMMVIFWGVTPLISSVFTRSVVMQQAHTTAKTTGTLMPLQDQNPALNTDFMMTAYGIVWLGQEMPGFVTAQGALEPFEVDSMHATDMLNTTWKAQTRLHGTSLKCDAAEIKNDSSSISYSNRKGCTTDHGYSPLYPESKSRFGALYIGYYLDQFSDYSLSGMGCPSLANSHLFLALWGQSSGGNHGGKVSSTFCEPSYWTQEVNATVTIPSMNILEVIPTAPRIPVADSDFNRTAFEFVIGTGSQLVSQRADISETTTLINQHPNLAKFDLGPIVTNMVGFALGLSSLEVEAYTDPHILATTFENAHKLLHALAIMQLMSHKVDNGQRRPATVTGKALAIIVVRPLAVVVEVLLGLVVVLILALMLHSHTRKSQLEGDPASLTEIIAMYSEEHECGYGKKLSQEPSVKSSLQHSIVEGKILVAGVRQSGHSLTRNDPLGQSPQNVASCSVGKDETVSLARPLEMHLMVGVMFIAILLLASGTMLALKLYANHHNGLPLPSNSTILNQLVLNFVLIVFATFLEPFWLLLNRHLCVLQPFEELRQANAKASRSLDLKYTSLPPQLVLWRALRGRHYLLGAVCAIGLSANILAVSLSGLLEINPVPMERMRRFTYRYESSFSRISDIPNTGTSPSDHQYIAKANISNGVSLPPWTAPDTFFVPFDLGTSLGSGQADQYRATTQGFGVRPDCEPANFNDTALINGHHNFFYTTQRTSSGKNVTCGRIGYHPYGGQNKSLSALEVFLQLEPIDINGPPSIDPNVVNKATEEEKLTCNSLLVAGFLRANLTVSLEATKTENMGNSGDIDIERINSLSSLWMICRPSLLTAPYELTVDHSGHVQSYAATGPYAKDLSPFFINGTRPGSLVNVTSRIMSEGTDVNPWWHNDTFVDTWFAYFIKHLSDSTRFVDPAQPIPTFKEVAPYVENLCVRLFAIVLSLNQEWLAEAKPGSTTAGVVISPSRRVFVSKPMFIITVTLLTLNLAVAIAYWGRRPKRMLPKMPYDIDSILTMVNASGLVDEVKNQRKWRKEWRFGYGKFVGTDGRPHVGIERRPFVVPLDT